MARKSTVKTMQTSFIGGEIDETVFLRLDKEQYRNSVQKARNVYVNPQGYISRREGLQYVDGTTSNAEACLVPFQFNNIQDYLLVFTPGEFKVYRDDVLQATVSSSPISELTADQIQEMDFTQSADTLILVHPDVQTIEITRTSHTSWAAASVTFEDVPVFAYSGTSVSEPAANITLGSVSGRDVLVTATASVFTASHEKQFILGKTGGILFIKSYVSSTQVRGDIQIDFPSTTVDSTFWELEEGHEDVWSDDRGWPTSVTFFQSRLWMGGSKSRPQTLWGSKIADFFNFDVGEGDDSDAIDVTVSSDELNAIIKIFPGRNLQVFTTGGEYYIPNREDAAITPVNVSILRATEHGTKSVLPVSVDGATIFIERNGKVIREFFFNDLEKSYNATDISINAPHLIADPVRMGVRKSTDSIPADFVYLVNADGTVAVLSTLRSQNLAAWSLFTTTGSFEQVAVVDKDVYFVVNRTIDGGTVRYIEKLNSSHFMDASEISTSDTPTDAWTDFDHLESETVKVRGDDYILDDVTVTSGNFTSSREVSEIEAGLNFLAEIKSVPVDVEVDGNTLTGDFRRLVYANIRLYQSRNIKVQYGGNTYLPPFRKLGDLLDAPIANFSGYKKVYLNGVDREPAITITQDEPLEFNVIGMTVGMR